MNKQTIKIIITEAIKFLASKYHVTELEIMKELESGHQKLTDSFAAIVKVGMEVV